jgi:hypothetical protein
VKLFGLSGDRQLFRKLTSHPQQVIGCELFEALDGEMRDQRILRVRNGELELEILVDRGFDIGRVLYRGIPTQWVSPSGFRHANSFVPSAVAPDGWGWLRSWPGGFLTTVGFDHIGGPKVLPSRHLHPGVTGEPRFTHGFASFSPTQLEKVEVDWESGKIKLQAQVRQAAPFLEHLVLTRRIELDFGTAEFRLIDSIRNDGYIDEAVQVLYHVNLGWPLLAPGATVTTSCSELLAATPLAEKDQPAKMPKPTSDAIERVWDWHARSGKQWAQLRNESIGDRGALALKVIWDGDELPHFMQWRNACDAMYVQGLEPSTTGLLGRENDNSHMGPAPFIKPGEARSFTLDFTFSN